MKQVFIIMWLGQPKVFGSYNKAAAWLLERVPYLTDVEVRFSIYQREVELD